MTRIIEYHKETTAEICRTCIQKRRTRKLILTGKVGSKRANRGIKC